MRVTVEKQPNSAVTLDIAADDDEFSSAMDRAFRRVNDLVSIPGFRPGKAPRRLVEQRVGRDLIVQEAHRDILDSLYQKALDQEEITPVSEPEVDIYQDEPVAFKVTVEIYPTLEFGDYTEISVEPREVNVTDEEVEEVIQNIQKQQSVWAEPDEERTPGEGDQVILDFEVFEGEEQFHDPVVGADFVLGEGPLFTQIEEAVKHLRPGEEAEFDIPFEEDDEDVPVDIRGKNLHYKVKLQEVKVRELPEPDDEFAQSVGEYDTFDALQAEIRRDLLQNKVQQSRDEFLNEAFEKFAELANLEVPEGLVSMELDREFQQQGQRLTQQGFNMDEYLRMTNRTAEEMKEEMRPEVANRVRNSLVLETFGEAEGVEVGDEDLDAEIERMVGESEQAEQMRELYQSDYFKDMLRSQLQNRKVTDRLIEVVSGGQGAITGEGRTLLDELESKTSVETSEIEGSADSPQAGEEPEDSEATMAVDDSSKDDSDTESEDETKPEPAAAATSGERDEASDPEKKPDA